MISFKRVLVTSVLAASMALPLSAQAEVLVNEWTEFNTPPLPNKAGCGDSTFFVVEGMSHTKISTLRNGNWAVNVNVMGTFTPLDGTNAGEPAIFRQNIKDVLPIYEGEDNAVYTFGEVTRVIGKGQAGNYRLNINSHVTNIDGEAKSYFEVERVSCR